MIPGSANPLLLAPAGGGYQVQRSLRFNSSDSAYLSRTPAVAGDRRTWTWAGWVKRSGLGDKFLFSAYIGSGSTDNDYFGLRFVSSDQLRVGGYSTVYRLSTAVFRDVSAWYHVVCAVDTTQATATNRIKLWVNGSQITIFSTENNPTQNADLGINQAAGHTIGREAGFASYFDGYLADIHFIDGQALTPSSFTEVSATTGQLVPIAYTGTFGTNGFWLKFSDNSAATAAALGNDYSGNNNDWTPNNLSVTAGAGNDSLVDTPTSYGTDTGVGGEVRGNYATLNPLDNGGLTLSNGNLQFDRATASWISGRATIGMSSGKWYWEVVQTTGTSMMVGISKGDASQSNYVGAVATGWAYNSGDGNKYNNASNSAYGNTYTTNDVIGVAFDVDSGDLKFYKNGTVQNSGTAAYTGLTSGPYFPAVSLYVTATAFTNFGQRAFAYTAPSGFKALCDTNLPAPVVAKPNTVMDVKLYTGNSSTQTISGLGFSPDLVWIKPRSQPYHGALYDVIRGTGKILYSSLTNSEDTYANSLTAFNSDGFSLGADGSSTSNSNGTTHVAWTWDAGTSTVSNTSGSITSQVRANASAGFSVVTWTGTGSNATVGHGLGVAPQLLIIKRRSGANDWIVGHTSLGGWANILYLNLTNATDTASTIFQSTAPTSTLFSLGTSTYVNGSSETYVAYCFAPVSGYSSFGSYTGNGSADGPFIFTSLRPAFVLIKATGAVAGNWMIYDNKRGAFNLNSKKLAANSSFEENEGSNLGGDSIGIDFLSNGFKIRTTGPNHNNSSVAYVYACFAESPFQYARAR